MANNMYGNLRANTAKTDDRQPTLRGEMIIDNVEYKIAAWLKGEGNDKYYSLAIQRGDAWSPKADK